jgi:hypothetical protein
VRDSDVGRKYPLASAFRRGAGYRHAEYYEFVSNVMRVTAVGKGLYDADLQLSRIRAIEILCKVGHEAISEACTLVSATAAPRNPMLRADPVVVSREVCRSSSAFSSAPRSTAKAVR